MMPRVWAPPESNVAASRSALLAASTTILPPWLFEPASPAKAVSARPLAETLPAVDLTVTRPPDSPGPPDPPTPSACTAYGATLGPTMLMSSSANRSIHPVPLLPPPPESAFTSPLWVPVLSTVSGPPDQISTQLVELLGLSGRSGDLQPFTPVESSWPKATDSTNPNTVTSQPAARWTRSARGSRDRLLITPVSLTSRSQPASRVIWRPPSVSPGTPDWVLRDATSPSRFIE